MDSVSRDKLKEKSFKRLVKSFKYAVEGIIYAFKYEQNIIVHTLVMILVILLGIVLKISMFEWLICLILFGLVIATEMINTSIEATVDLACDKKDPLAKIAKDTASGAVLVFAITASVSGIIIFLPKIIDIIKTL
ncbi:MAG: diacylglycerol kinase family protein [Bacilli bacterium]